MFDILLEFPVCIAKWTNLTGFEPSGDTMEMKSMITDSPSNCTFLRGRSSSVCLTINAQIHTIEKEMLEMHKCSHSINYTRYPYM